MKNVLSGALIVALVGCSAGRALARQSDRVNANITAEIQQAVDELLRSARYLEWDAFRACFASDATVLYMGKSSRSDGWEGLESFFRPLFDGPAKTGSPPYLTIEPIDLQIQLMENSAVVTYLLGGEEAERTFRTLVYQKRDGQWLIVHLHASNPLTAQ